MSMSTHGWARALDVYQTTTTAASMDEKSGQAHEGGQPSRTLEVLKSCSDSRSRQSLRENGETQ
eukprot:713011-Amphidinium_carterae.1